MLSPRLPVVASDPALLALWRSAERVLCALSLANFAVAVLVKLLGPGLHPLFSDPDAALMFLVTGLGLLAHAVVLAILRWRLRAGDGGAMRPLNRLRAFMRLPIHADFAAQRGAARLRMRGRPAGRAAGMPATPARRRSLA